MRLPGIEPGTPGWEPGILPLYYKRIQILYFNEYMQLNFFLKSQFNKIEFVRKHPTYNQKE
jgi:hypothetical protein